MKRVLSLVLALVMVFGTIMPAFAEDAATMADSQAGKDLESYGVIAGTEKGLDEATALTRAMMATILADLYGKKAEATAYAFLPSFTDVQDEAMWYTPYVAFAEQQGWMSGDAAGGTFRPNDTMTTQEVNAAFVKVLGYTVEWAEVNAKATELEVAVVAADDAKVLRGEAFAALRAALDVPKMDMTDTLGTALALKVYMPKTPAAPTAVAVTGAVSVNSMVIEVALDSDLDAPTALTVDQFTVTDKDAAVLAVSAVEFAPWDADMYTVLVTLEADTVAGTLYTLTSGDVSVNFGGVSKDAAKPAVVGVTSTDYNEVTVEFDEAVLADTVVFGSTEKYGAATDMMPVFVKYSTSTKLVYTTADQKASTLYATSVEGATDLAGNVITKDTAKTYVGQAMPTAKQSVTTATVTDSLSIKVDFAVNVDQATALVASNYVVTEKYGTKAEIAVVSVEMFENTSGVVEKDKVVLTLASDTKAATLYGLEVLNVATLYGKELNTSADTATFTGVAADVKAPNGIVVTAVSNTELKVAFEYASVLDKISADVDATLVAVTAKYGDKAALELAVKEIKSNYILFTTSAQTSATLYDVKVAAGIVDAKGNVTTAELTSTVVGAGVAAKITTVAATNTVSKGTELTVEFAPKSYGTGALDVGSYFIDGGVGYPTKVVKKTGSTTAVVLTIKDTKPGTLYKLTVKNVNNADGVAMATDGITTNFVGTGADSSLAKLEAVVALDANTVKLYFDTNVEDIAGLTGSTGAVTGDAIEFDNGVDGTTDGTDFDFAWEDPTNAKVLIAYKTGATPFADGLTDDAFTVDVTSADVDTTKDTVLMAENATAPSLIKVEGIVATNDSTIKVFFNQPVRHILAGTNNGNIANEFAFVDLNGNGTFDVTDAEILTARSLNDDMTQWEIGLDQTLAAAEYKLVVTSPSVDADISTLVAGTSLVKVDTVTTAYAFAGNATSDPYVSDVYAVATDTRTIKVMFPEAMDSTDVQDVSKYTVVQTDNTDLTNAKIVLAKYSATDNSVTLTLDGAFTVTADNYYLVVSNTVKNAVGNKTVKKDATTDVKSQFALSTTAPAKVTVKSVTVAGQVITIKMNQQSKSTADITALAVADANNLVADLAITFDSAAVALAGNQITSVATSLASVDVADSTAGFWDTIVITVDTTVADGVNGVDLTLNATGTVDFTAANGFVGINGETEDADMTALIFVQK